jgi:hypothetical protein
MKETTLEQFAQDLHGFLEAAQYERILVTRNGEPFVVVAGLAYKDEEDYRLEASPEFWKMIEERRKEPTVPLKEIEAELFPEEQEGRAQAS